MRLDRRRAAAASAAACFVAAKARGRLGLPAPITTASLFAMPLILSRGFDPSAGRDAAVWATQMLAYKNAFELPNDDPERLRRRAHVDYPVLIDRVIGLGAPPGRRLQRRLRRGRRLSRLDKVLTFFYWTWEAEPHAVLAWIRWRHPEHFAAAAARLAAVFDSTLIGYWALPSAPPWWASEQAGRMDGDVHRVMPEVSRWLKGKRSNWALRRGDHELGANPFAAMPSDHFAAASMTALVMADVDRRAAAAGAAYALLLAFALVYLGEHYVIDLLAGLALTLAVNSQRDPLETAADRLLGYAR